MMKHLGKSSPKSIESRKCAISQPCKSRNVENILQQYPNFVQVTKIKQIMRPCKHAIKRMQFELRLTTQKK